MKKLIIGVVGIMVLITFGMFHHKNGPAHANTGHPSKPPANEMAILWFERGNAYRSIRGL